MEWAWPRRDFSWNVQSSAVCTGADSLGTDSDAGIGAGPNGGKSCEPLCQGVTLHLGCLLGASLE